MQTTDDAERREYYRISDRVALEITPHETGLTPSAEEASRQAPLFAMLCELHLSDFESQHLLRQVGEGNRALAAFLRAQNKRIDLLTQVMAQSILGSIGEPQPVVLSEAGLEFSYPRPLAEASTLDVRMALMPQALGVMLRARVVRCDANAAGSFDVGVEFENSTDAQRQLLARYVLQHQAAERRKLNETQALQATS
ncbi:MULTISPECIES: PilZ domain-containing protein [unclassified Pseudomonas]|uniref:PilZ domain-containing protein n=1 Tax=unclassified Pseudomonas TaxID=196821 RepID=UPI000BC8FEF9|nr:MULTISPECIES: PilZ domain-containing protein [unclassified Pseudomonas]PVZ20423.1 PilZ domain-containing protein [Pseudomonas sp. URIL14HWK12:I12]PVZ27489.1 PilZ domain-containing protein [Pseudomonas sp. URIL14HWK12:I10]PVZ38378.1 PilZ domain-containing protein [Pseudomonas sp. URIL14HWK12:I11]SNZ03596.1 PilZ domain-containing protein [Pseudomonas sp. URIL14HWK12:I9]